MTEAGKRDIVEQGFERLEKLLEEERLLYTRLDGLVDDQREAVRCADVQSLVVSSSSERELVEAIRTIDLRRGELVEAIGAEVGLASAGPPSLSDLLEFSGSRRSRLVAIADELRGLIGKVRAASGVVRVAAESLARHMQGIVQSVEAGFSRAGVYERAGRIANGSPWQTAIDIRS